MGAPGAHCGSTRPTGQLHWKPAAVLGAAAHVPPLKQGAVSQIGTAQSAPALPFSQMQFAPSVVARHTPSAQSSRSAAEQIVTIGRNIVVVVVTVTAGFTVTTVTAGVTVATVTAGVAVATVTGVVATVGGGVGGGVGVDGGAVMTLRVPKHWSLLTRSVVGWSLVGVQVSCKMTSPEPVNVPSWIG